MSLIPFSPHTYICILELCTMMLHVCTPDTEISSHPELFLDNMDHSHRLAGIDYLHLQYLLLRTQTTLHSSHSHLAQSAPIDVYCRRRFCIPKSILCPLSLKFLQFAGFSLHLNMSLELVLIVNLERLPTDATQFHLVMLPYPGSMLCLKSTTIVQNHTARRIVHTNFRSQLRDTTAVTANTQPGKKESSIQAMHHIKSKISLIILSSPPSPPHCGALGRFLSADAKK